MFDFKYKTRIISGRSPDYDFAYMSHSKYFVKSDDILKLEKW